MLLPIHNIPDLNCTEGGQGNTLTLQGRNGYLITLLSLSYESVSVIGHGPITATVGLHLMKVAVYNLTELQFNK